MARAKAPKSSHSGDDLSERIVEEALAIAAEVGWDRVRLRRVAERLDVPLPEIRRHYRDLDAIADAWFARALDAMLAPGEAGFTDLPARERVYLVMMRWFEAQQSKRAIVGQMLGTKLYLSHPHHWVPMIFSLSRLIQWLREAAVLDAPGRRRQVEEVGLTLLFLVTMRVWLRDGSKDFGATRRFLRRRLETADGVLAATFRRSPVGTRG